MAVQLGQARKIKLFCTAQYAANPRYHGYNLQCGLSRVNREDPNAPPETRYDLCVTIRSTKPLPRSLAIPTEKDGVRIYVRVQETKGIRKQKKRTSRSRPRSVN